MSTGAPESTGYGDADAVEPVYVAKSRKYDIPGFTDIGQKPYGGLIDQNVKSYTQQYDKGDEQTQERLKNAKSIADSFYTLVTDFYEYGYGHSFHFAPVMDGQTFAESIASYERGVGRTLGAKPGMKILDVGCGIGGPQREIAKHSGAHIVGLNCCEYQLKRAKDHSLKAGLQDTCTYVKGDFTDMEFEDNMFDGAYAFEATCHANDPAKVYSEVCRVLKPGALFVDCAWALTDSYDANNPEHVKIKDEILIGNGLPELRTQARLLQDLRKGGFEVVEFRNAHRDGDLPWYTFIAGRQCCSLQNFRMSSIGRLTTHGILSLLETVRVAPKGSCSVHSVLCTAADALIASGKLDIFTPEFRIVARKPLTDS